VSERPSAVLSTARYINGVQPTEAVITRLHIRWLFSPGAGVRRTRPRDIRKSGEAGHASRLPPSLMETLTQAVTRRYTLHVLYFILFISRDTLHPPYTDIYSCKALRGRRHFHTQKVGPRNKSLGKAETICLYCRQGELITDCAPRAIHLCAYAK